MAAIDVQVTGQREIVAALQRVVDVLGAHGAQTMQAVGEVLRTGVDDEFETSGEGEWDPLRPMTERMRMAAGQRPPFTILVRSARLRRSIQIAAHPHGVSVGTNVTYAPLHQFGGRSESGAKVPARPFLVMRDDTAREIVATVEERLAAAWDDSAPRSV